MKTIVWDVDDVLNELMKNWFEGKWLPEHRACSLRYETIRQNPPQELLGVSREEYLASLDSFRSSDAFSGMQPLEEVVAWFRSSGHRFRHIALTATPITCAPHSAAWVLRHFGEWVRTFAFVPSPRSSDPQFTYDATKKEYLVWWGRADILIDDNTAHVAEAETSGMRSFLVPRPWNNAKGSLTDILKTLDGMA